MAPLSKDVSGIAERMERFEASASVPDTGTGKRREGGEFEALVLAWWRAVASSLRQTGADLGYVQSGPGRFHYRLSQGRRALYIPGGLLSQHDSVIRLTPLENRTAWFFVNFNVSELVEAFPGNEEAIQRYAPKAGPYSGHDYPRMYTGLQTKFDGTLILEENGILREKLLLEYKTAKSSNGHQIDGNAHERLSFQIMQYLEVATRYTKCSLVVFGNGAFASYRNKYHVNFHIQAERLSNFSWFHMEYLCTSVEYMAFAERLSRFLSHQ